MHGRNWIPLAGLALAATLISPLPARAQTAQTAQTSDIDSYIELLRSDIKTSKKEIITQALDFSNDKTGAFWPLYNEYQLEMDKVGAIRVANIKDFGANFDKMTDVKASELMKTAFDFQEKRLAVHKRYAEKFSKVVGSVEAAKLMQVETVLQDLIDLQIGANLPMIEKTAPATTER
jgi:hypothetical protein